MLHLKQRSTPVVEYLHFGERDHRVIELEL